MKIEQGKLNTQANTLADLAKVSGARRGGALPGRAGLVPAGQAGDRRGMQG